MNHVTMIAELDGWSREELAEALMDVRGGMDMKEEWNVHRGNLIYGVVISSNLEADRRVAGFPEFGDIVLWNRKRGFDCKAIEKLVRENATETAGQVCNHDKSRSIAIGTATPVILNWKTDIIGIVSKWDDHTKQTSV